MTTPLADYAGRTVHLRQIPHVDTLLGYGIQGINPDKIYFINNQIWIRFVEGCIVTVSLSPVESLAHLRIRKVYSIDGVERESRKEYAIETVAQTTHGEIVVTCKVTDNGSAHSSDGNDDEASYYTSLYEIKPNGHVVKCVAKGNYSEVCSHGDKIYALKRQEFGEGPLVHIFQKGEITGENGDDDGLEDQKWKELTPPVDIRPSTTSIMVSSKHFIYIQGENKNIYKRGRISEKDAIEKTPSEPEGSANSRLCASDADGSVLVYSTDSKMLRVLHHGTNTFSQLSFENEPSGLTIKHATLDQHGHLYVLYSGSRGWGIFKAE